MHLFFYSALSWLILAFFGLNLCVLLLPSRLKQYTLIIAPIFGYSYIVLVSYYCYRFDLNGTNSYAWPITLITVAFSLFLFVKNKSLLKNIFDRDVLYGLGFSLLSWLALSAIFFIKGMPLVSLALSNLDVAELAVESRFLQEFNRTADYGFLGQTGWLKVVGDDIWFGPSAIVAFICSLINLEPYKAQTLILHVLAAQGAAIFYLLIGFFGDIAKRVRLGATVLYAISPIIIYTAWQSFGAQTIAIPISLLIFELYLNITKDAGRKISYKELLPLILLFSALLLTYHFIVLIIFFLIATHEVVSAFIKKSYIQLYRNVKFLVLLAILLAVINPYRVISIVETFAMVATSTNGWFIPWINPLSQIGIYSHPEFFGGYSPSYYKYFIYPATMALLFVLGMYLRLNFREKIVKNSFFLGLFLPVFIMGLYFALIGREMGQLGSYRSFKITSIFCGFTFVVCVFPLTDSFLRGRKWRGIFVLTLFVLLALSSVWSLSRILASHRPSIYILPKEVIELQQIEEMNEIPALNILDLGNFSNLWANYFLLKKVQVFQKFPYGGRVVGELNQPFTLIGRAASGDVSSKNILSIGTDGMADGRRDINVAFAIQDSTSSGAYTLTLGDGWWDAEPQHQWSGRSGSSAEIFLDTQTPETLIIEAQYGKLRTGDSIQIFVDGKPLAAKFSEEGFVSGAFTVNSGRHIIKLIEELPPSPPSSHDGRTLGILWKSISVIQKSAHKSGMMK